MLAMVSCEQQYSQENSKLVNIVMNASVPTRVTKIPINSNILN